MLTFTDSIITLSFGLLSLPYSVFYQIINLSYIKHFTDLSHFFSPCPILFISLLPYIAIVVRC